MNDGAGHDRRKGWFFWGLALVGTSSIPFLVAFFHTFRGMSPNKATGLGAVAGGLTEAYVSLGFIMTLVLPIASIFVLGRSLPGADRTRKLFSYVLIVCSSFIIMLSGLGGWFFLVQMPRLFSSHR